LSRALRWVKAVLNHGLQQDKRAGRIGYLKYRILVQAGREKDQQEEDQQGWQVLLSGAP